MASEDVSTVAVVRCPSTEFALAERALRPSVRTRDIDGGTPKRGMVDGRLRAAPWSMSNTPVVLRKPYLGGARFHGAIMPVARSGRHRLAEIRGFGAANPTTCRRRSSTDSTRRELPGPGIG
jgi:hypothetical protein